MYEKPVGPPLSEQIPAFKPELGEREQPEITPVMPISAPTGTDAIHGVVSNVDGIALWRFMSETYRNRRLAQEQKLKPQEQLNVASQIDEQEAYESDHLELSALAETPKDIHNQLLYNIRLAQLQIPEDYVIRPIKEEFLQDNDGILKINQYMTTQVISIIDSTPIKYIAALFHRKHISGIPVIDYLSQHLVGLITMSDIIAHSYTENPVSTFQVEGSFFEQKSLAILEQPVRDIMQTHVITVDPYYPVKNACQLMVEKNIHRLIITEHNRVKGIFTTFDATRVLSSL